MSSTSSTWVGTKELCVIFWPNSPVESYRNGVFSETWNVMLKLILERKLVKV